MNILIVNSGGGWGGIESHSVTLSLGLTKRGHRTVIACSESGHVHANASELALPINGVKVLNACDLISVAKIMRIASREKAGVIVANLGKEYWPSALAAKLLCKKIVLVRHQRDRIRKTTRWLMNNYIDVVIAVSGSVKDALLASGISEEKIRVIHNAIPLSRFESSKIDRGHVRRELGIAEDDIIIGTVGKLNRGKGVYSLLRAIGRIKHKFPSLKALYVGDGPEKDGIIREAQELSMGERVIIAGIRRDVERMYAAMDAFVLPSLNEGLPTVVVEAMAMNIPVIATPVGGVPEIIQDGENGLLVPPGDDEALTSSIVRLLADGEFAAHIAARGRQTVECEFSDSTLAEGFEKIFLALGMK